MTSIQWTQDMSVNVDSIDTDHKILFKLLNQFDEAVRLGMGVEVVASVLDALLDYTDYHFQREETLMQACGYPDFDAHKYTHNVLRTQVIHIRDRHAANPDTIHDREVLAFLRNWLTAHIMGRDKLYAPFMASKPGEVQAAEAKFAEQQGQQP